MPETITFPPNVPVTLSLADPDPSAEKYNLKGPLSPLYQDVKRHADRLHALFASPRPDLRPWCIAVALECKAISELYRGESPDAS